MLEPPCFRPGNTRCYANIHRPNACQVSLRPGVLFRRPAYQAVEQPQDIRLPRKVSKQVFATHSIPGFVEMRSWYALHPASICGVTRAAPVTPQDPECKPSATIRKHFVCVKSPKSEDLYVAVSATPRISSRIPSPRALPWLHSRCERFPRRTGHASLWCLQMARGFRPAHHCPQAPPIIICIPADPTDGGYMTSTGSIRDREEPHGSSPPTPPYERVTYTAVR